jgi:HEAT repeat protein
MTSPGEALLHIRELAKAKDIDGLISELDNPLEDEIITPRGRAADHLGRIRAKKAVEPLIRMLQTDPNEHARTHAVRALAKSGRRTFFRPCGRPSKIRHLPFAAGPP